MTYLNDYEADWLRTLIAASGRSLYSLSRKAGLSDNTVKWWITGRSRRIERKASERVLEILVKEETWPWR